MMTTETSAYVPPRGDPDLTERAAIINSLWAWIKQRPGLEFGNYGDFSAYRSEMRGITRDLHHARTLLQAVSWRSSITAEHLKQAMRGAYSGRLSWIPEQRRLDYCTGQYWPTEYRRAACAVLASALWNYMRENMPKGKLMHNSETGETLERYKGMRAGDYLRSQARKEFGKAIADRWFN